MTKRALLVGSPTNGLRGVGNDLALLSDELGRRGFTDQRILDAAQATRAGALDALARLVGDVRTEDDVVVGYSGHGARLRLAAGAARELQGRDGYLHFLVPTDFGQSTSTDFRGILAAEVSHWQWRLTDRARTVTTILDCCHSGTIARSLDVRLKALADWQLSSAHAAGAELLLDRAEGRLRRDGRLGLTNPRAVRIVACAVDESAYEMPAAGGGGPVGLLTEALVAELRRVGEDPVPWRVLLARVRGRVTARMPAQRPAAEGPADRLPFGVASRTVRHSLPVDVAGDGVARIRGGAILGLAVGDRVRLLDGTGAVAGWSEVIARADADAVLAATPTIQAGTMAVIPSAGSRPLLVRLGEDVDRAVDQGTTALVPAPPRGWTERLGAALSARPPLAVAGAGEPSFAGVVAGLDGLWILDASGARLRADPVAADGPGLDWLVDVLDVVGHAERVRSWTRADDSGGFDSHVRLSVQALDGETWKALPAGGSMLPAGSRVRASLTNGGPAKIYVSLLDVTPSGRTSVLTGDSPSGRPLMPGESTTIGFPDGLELTWPADVPPEIERLETLLAIVTSAPFEAAALEASDPPHPGRTAPWGSPSVQPSGGSLRGLRSPDESVAGGLRYDVVRCDIWVEPAPDATFGVVERPSTAVRALTPRRGAAVPAGISLNLAALTLSAPSRAAVTQVRVDWLVITAGAPKSESIRTGTVRVHQPLTSELALYAGPVHGVVEAAIWLSHGDGGAGDLPDLLAEATESQEWQAVWTSHSRYRSPGKPPPEPTPASEMAATNRGQADAEAVMALAAGLLRRRCACSEGIWRASLAPIGGFGVGRHPRSGHHDARGVAFALVIRPQAN